MTIQEAEARSHEHPILFYDGICVLCQGFVQWLIKRDKKEQFYYASLQQTLGQKVNQHLNIDETDDSVILLHQGRYFTRADVSLEVVRLLGFPYSLLRIAKVVPKSIRDRVYQWIAANRYQWFGKDESCLIPSGELKARLIEIDPNN